MISKVEFQGQPIGYRLIDGEHQTVYSDEFELLMVDDREDGNPAVRQVGYVWEKPDRRITLIRRVDEQSLVMIQRLVKEARGHDYPISQPCEIPESIDEDEEGDFDDDEG